MTNSILAQRTYSNAKGEFTVGLRPPLQDGENWFCEVFTEGLDRENIMVGGIDPLQAIRLASPVIDSIVNSQPDAQCLGITGVF